MVSYNIRHSDKGKIGRKRFFYHYCTTGVTVLSNQCGESHKACPKEVPFVLDMFPHDIFLTI